MVEGILPRDEAARRIKLAREIRKMDQKDLIAGVNKLVAERERREGIYLRDRVLAGDTAFLENPKTKKPRNARLQATALHLSLIAEVLDLPDWWFTEDDLERALSLKRNDQGTPARPGPPEIKPLDLLVLRDALDEAERSLRTARSELARLLQEGPRALPE